jgi:hypothetical protein
MNSDRLLRMICFLNPVVVAALFLVLCHPAGPRRDFWRTDSSPVASVPQVTEWHVCQSGGQTLLRFAAVDAAQPGDLIKVARRFTPKRNW